MHFDLTKPETLFLREDFEAEFFRATDRKTLQQVLAWGLLLKVSDLAFSDGMPITAKINNMVFRISRRLLNPQILKHITSLLNQSEIGDDMIYTKITSGEEVNCSYKFQINDSSAGYAKKPTSVRYRVNFVKDTTSISTVMRLNNDKIMTLEELGLTEASPLYSKMLGTLKGLNLVTGAVDSGKTTLLYALLAHFIRYDPRPAFIGTFENPIEADLKGVLMELLETGVTELHGRPVFTNKFVTQTQVVDGVNTFLGGVSASLRRNTDIIMLGEIRTPAEVDAVIAGIMQTGKLVTATMHSDSVAMTIDRLVYAMSATSEGERRAKIYDLLSSLNCIASQKLLTTVNLKRTAVNEILHFTPEIRQELQNTPPERLTHAVQQIMNDSQATMVHMARQRLSDGIISRETFEEFERGFAR